MCHLRHGDVICVASAFDLKLLAQLPIFLPAYVMSHYIGLDEFTLFLGLLSFCVGDCAETLT